MHDALASSRSDGVTAATSVKVLLRRRADRCADCRSDLPVGTKAGRDAAARTGHCLACADQLGERHKSSRHCHGESDSGAIVRRSSTARAAGSTASLTPSSLSIRNRWRSASCFEPGARTSNWTKIPNTPTTSSSRVTSSTATQVIVGNATERDLLRGAITLRLHAGLDVVLDVLDPEPEVLAGLDRYDRSVARLSGRARAASPKDRNHLSGGEQRFVDRRGRERPLGIVGVSHGHCFDSVA